jgi:NAD(P)H-dependent FMN reductase
MNIRSASSSDLARLRQELSEGHAVNLTDVRLDDIFALADELAEEEQLEHMVTYRKNVTGVDNTVFISPKVHARHAARVKVAINPPDTISPTSETISVSIHDGSVVAGNTSSVTATLLDQVRQFIAMNKDALIDYWEERIDTDELRQRLKSIG